MRTRLSFFNLRRTPSSNGVLFPVAASLSLLIIVSTLGIFEAVSANPAPSGRYIDPIFSEITVTEDLPYSQSVNEKGRLETHLMDLYEPDGDLEPRRPAIIWVHGGSFESGSKTASNMKFYAKEFAKRGYVAASINYRLVEDWPVGTPEGEKAQLDAQDDAAAAVRYLRAHAQEFRIDPDRISMGGWSAGSITSLYVAFNHERAPGSNTSTPGFPSHISAAVCLAGVMWDPTFIQPSDPPLIMFRGTEDKPFLWPYVTAIIDRAREVGIPVEFYPIEGAGHSLYKEGYGPFIVEKAAAFLYRYVLQNPPVDVPSPTAIPVTPTPARTPGAEDLTPPQIHRFQVTVSDEVLIEYEVFDEGGSHLDRLEVWRAAAKGNLIDPQSWHEVHLLRQSAGGQDRLAGQLVLGLPEGTWWLRLHAVDGAGNWAFTSPSGPSVGSGGAAPGSFLDVPTNHWAYPYVEALYHGGYVNGCNPASDPDRRYCPDRFLDRAEMSVFMLRGKHGGAFQPQDPEAPVFADVPPEHWAFDWTAALWDEKMTSGCGGEGLNYCPDLLNTNAEAAVFMLRIKHGSAFSPPTPAGNPFQDLPSEAWYTPWMLAAFNEGLLGPCRTQPVEICPLVSLPRSKAAYMMSTAKGLIDR
jgi:acetyl esterase/lipase